MSTRSVIIVTGSNKYNGTQTTRLYKHSDGYPTGNLRVIADALATSKKQCDQANKRWGDDKAQISQSQAVGHIIGASTDEYGQGAEVEKTYLDEFRPTHLGTQGDIEWVYIVNTDEKTVHVYGGGYTSPKEHFKHGPTDPTSYAENLYEEFQEKERNEIKQLMRRIENTGFHVNPKTFQEELIAA